MKKIFIFALILFAVSLTACTPERPSLESTLLGTWQDSQGFQIEFRSGGVGYIPGVDGNIPNSNFTYQIIDGQHVQIETQGQQVTIELIVDGDKLTWKDKLGEVIYYRLKR